MKRLWQRILRGVNNMSDLVVIQVKIYSERTGELGDREYTYYSKNPVAVGDLVTVPVTDYRGDFPVEQQAKALVISVGVEPPGFDKFKHKVKTI